MSMPLRVLILSGRYLAENPHRELGIVEALQKRGCEVTFALPARSLNKNGYTDDMRENAVFVEANAVWLENEEEFSKAIADKDVFLCGSWKSYHTLVDIARSKGVFTSNYMSTGGADHWPNGVDQINVRSPFDKRRMASAIENLPSHLKRGNPAISVTGGVLYNGVDVSPTPNERQSICAQYGVDPAQPLIVLFPKGIESFRSKVRGWYPDWNEKACTDYCENLESVYREICQEVTSNFGHILIKMHPTAYTSYMCESGLEYDYWRQIDGAIPVRPEHSLPLYRSMDIGLGVTSHAAMDANYFGKPFIYVDAQKIPIPPLSAFQIHEFSMLRGPSDAWSDADPFDNSGCYLPAWVGSYCSSTDLHNTLTALLENEHETHSFFDMFNREFWHVDGDQASEMIAEQTLFAYAASRAKVSTGFWKKLVRFARMGTNHSKAHQN